MLSDVTGMYHNWPYLQEPGPDRGPTSPRSWRRSHLRAIPTVRTPESAEQALSDFAEAVKDEGTGRITSGPHAGKYLNWSINTGYWIDAAPRDAHGRPLEPYVSAAADPSIPYDVPIKVLDCGVDKLGGSAIDPAICVQLRSAHWVVRDRFTVGSVGKHIDVYVGEEDQEDFLEKSPKVIHASDATMAVRR